MIDLHTHTDRSDGSTRPADLVNEACTSGLEALAIADHDTLAGYDAALPVANEKGLELICAVELSTRPEPSRPGKRERSVHVLGYFLTGPPSTEFRTWLETQQASRRKRNTDLIARLNQLGVNICLADVEVYGCNQVGRPHFARVLQEQGYVSCYQEAFDRYLADEADAGVERDEPILEEGIRRIVDGGGLASLAHPVRLSQRGCDLEALVRKLIAAGLQGLEVVHSEHSPANTAEYEKLSSQLDLIPTGGTDYHGENKPGIRLGTGIDGNVSLNYDFLNDMRERVKQSHADSRSVV